MVLAAVDVCAVGAGTSKIVVERAVGRAAGAKLDGDGAGLGSFPRCWILSRRTSDGLIGHSFALEGRYNNRARRLSSMAARRECRRRRRVLHRPVATSKCHRTSDAPSNQLVSSRREDQHLELFNDTPHNSYTHSIFSFEYDDEATRLANTCKSTNSRSRASRSDIRCPPRPPNSTT